VWWDAIRRALPPCGLSASDLCELFNKATGANEFHGHFGRKMSALATEGKAIRLDRHGSDRTIHYCNPL